MLLEVLLALMLVRTKVEHDAGVRKVEHNKKDKGILSAVKSN